ncbi:MAG: hypothetical protein QM811_24505 [Pirellulales bacterium]
MRELDVGRPAERENPIRFPTVDQLAQATAGRFISGGRRLERFGSFRQRRAGLRQLVGQLPGQRESPLELRRLGQHATNEVRRRLQRPAFDQRRGVERDPGHAERMT